MNYMHKRDDLPQPHMMKIIQLIASRPNHTHYVLMRGTIHMGRLFCEMMHKAFGVQAVLVRGGAPEMAGTGWCEMNLGAAVKAAERGEANLIVSVERGILLSGWQTGRKETNHIHCTFDLSEDDQRQLQHRLREMSLPVVVEDHTPRFADSQLPGMEVIEHMPTVPGELDG